MYLSCFESIVPSHSIVKCLETCLCMNQNYIVNCSTASLHVIPSGIQAATCTLVLSNNCIETIQSGSLYGLDSLTVLHLEYNLISNISPGSFHMQMEELEELYLNNNFICNIGEHTCQTRTQLVMLDMSHNRIYSIRKDIFSHKNHLVTLNISHNSIGAISDGAFNTLMQLVTLDLSHNPI